MSKSKRINETKQDNSPRISQREKYKGEIRLKEIQWTENQKKIVDCILDKQSRIIFISGPAGSGKSLLTAWCGLNLMANNGIRDYTFVRNPLECGDSAQLGYVKGDIESKFLPYIQILEEKLKEVVSDSTANELKNDDRINCVPTNYIRGLTFHSKYVHCEEAENLTHGEFKLLLTRFGKFSKMLIVADPSQTDLPKNKQGAFVKIFNIFNNQESKEKGIHCFKLEKCDIKRSEELSFIIDKLENVNSANDYCPSGPKI